MAMLRTIVPGLILAAAVTVIVWLICFAKV